MTSLTIGMIAAGCIFGGALAGFGLQRVLPKHHLSKEAQDMIKLEMNSPLDGFMKVSSAPLRKALEFMGQ